jgi:hypothetical protein
MAFRLKERKPDTDLIYLRIDRAILHQPGIMFATGVGYASNAETVTLAEAVERVRRNPGLEQSFRRIDANRFTATAYREGEKACRGSASLGGSTMGSESIEYSMTDEPRHGGMNEAVLVKTDDQMIYFEALGMQSFGSSKEKLTFQGAAELFWEIFIRPLQS